MAVPLVIIAAGVYLWIAYNPEPKITTPTPIEVKIGIGLFVIGYMSLTVITLKSKNLIKLIHNTLPTLFD
jgi:hypothetical protein